MRNILILNIGSSSIKYDIFQGETAVLKGEIEKVNNYDSTIKQILKKIEETGIKPDAVGHRVVHGGWHSEPALLDKKKIKDIEKISELAPLHNIPQTEGIKICMKLLKIPQVAVFDTAFHQTIPEKAYTYAIPKRFAEKYKIRRYGFHGNSHHYVALEAARLMGKPIEKTKIITCHLGAGCSVTAVKHGKSADTSMGMTPLEGLVMATRSGDIDPSLIPFLQHKEKMSYSKTECLLNKESGLKGICGKTDMRDIYNAKSDDADSRLAYDVFCYRIVKYIGAYFAAMDGADAIVFTGGIGENAWWLREEIIKSLRCLGTRLNKKANKKNKIKISSLCSRIKIYAIPTNEELMMVRCVRKKIEKQDQATCL